MEYLLKKFHGIENLTFNNQILIFNLKYLSPLSREKRANAFLIDRGDRKEIKDNSFFKNGACVDFLAPDFQKN